MEKNQKNHLRKYLDDQDLGVRQFARLSNIPYGTLQPIAAGKRIPQRRLAIRICKSTNGKLSLKDFGIEE